MHGSLLYTLEKKRLQKLQLSPVSCIQMNIFTMQKKILKCKKQQKEHHRNNRNLIPQSQGHCLLNQNLQNQRKNLFQKSKGKNLFPSKGRNLFQSKFRFQSWVKLKLALLIRFPKKLSKNMMNLTFQKKIRCFRDPNLPKHFK